MRRYQNYKSRNLIVMCLQKLIDKLYRLPMSTWRTKKRFGGYFSYNKMIREQKKMIDKSKKLPPIISNPNGFPIYFLTGKKYLYQTMFCAYSLNKSSAEKFQYVLVDDGSFDKALINQAKTQMPNVKIVLKEDIEKNLSQKLSLDKYPFLNYKRQVYPHIKKLTDIHTIDDSSFKLVLDSDMLFWNEPTEMIDWLKQPNGSLYMLDCEESYGYETALMQSLCGFEIPKLMNVGAFGIDSRIIDWEHVEKWSEALEDSAGASYFLEQALSAMLVAQGKKNILKNDHYIVNPENKNIDFTDVKLHHYVDLSKKYYFETAWKKI